MKRFLVTALQFALFLITYAVASFALPFHKQSILVHTGTLTRIYIWDGLLAALLLFAVILVIEAILKRLRPVAPWSLLALALALGVSFALKLGFVTREF